jgi:hypothetical protein
MWSIVKRFLFLPWMQGRAGQHIPLQNGRASTHCHYIAPLKWQTQTAIILIRNYTMTIFRFSVVGRPLTAVAGAFATTFAALSFGALAASAPASAATQAAGDASQTVTDLAGTGIASR